ncbi:hypothetical protein COLO4_32164 [Corchorus olitorius]|uniref:DUF4283 domain-containing protein n=1 Tax=Corchorus olitorius TaxID=93759 RepID=A0A1R3H0Q1_9ROSI|nr:hypothetical protein COLO4_32164 [Corchorus olitorius]
MSETFSENLPSPSPPPPDPGGSSSTPIFANNPESNPKIDTVQQNAKNPISYKNKLLAYSNHTYFPSWFNQVPIFEETGAQQIESMDCGGKPSITLSMEDRLRIRRPRRNSLILKLIGGNLRFMNLLILKKLWRIQSAFSVSDLGNGYYLARFKSPDEYYVALAGGPWFLNDRLLSVQRWIPNFRASENKLPSTMAIWVQLPELPIEYYDLPTLHQIASLIGTPIKIDANTSNTARTQYARLCVEVEIGKSLPKTILIEGEIQHIVSQRRRRTTRPMNQTLDAAQERVTQPIPHNPVGVKSLDPQVAHNSERPVPNANYGAVSRPKQAWKPKAGTTQPSNISSIPLAQTSNSFSILADL